VAHPLNGASFGTLRRVLAEARPGVPLADRLALRAAALGRYPFTLIEKALTAALVSPLSAIDPPTFILGHWRSGTTHLYNIMSLGEFAYVPPVAVGLPWEMLTLGTMFRTYLEKKLPESRFIDNIPVTATSPQEDEIAIANMTAMSFYHGIYFPRACNHFLERGLFFEGASKADIAEWVESFGLFARKVAWQQKKPLLIKNPVYTARPKLLRQLFPRAKFIHIHRDPFDLFLSMRNFWTRLFEALALQPWDHVDIDEVILATYRRMMTAFDQETKGWSAPEFVEVAYADLDQHPLETLAQIYGALRLPGFKAAQPRFAAYLESVRTFEKNRFAGDAAAIAKVKESWGPWIEKWGYRAPQPVA
jgi:hypothetical protein